MNIIPQEIPELEGKPVRVCVVCGEPKEKSKFFKEELNRIDGGDGISKDCRACRLKEAKINKDIHLREIGWKPPIKNTIK